MVKAISMRSESKRYLGGGGGNNTALNEEKVKSTQRAKNHNIK